MRISYWSSDVCSSDLDLHPHQQSLVVIVFGSLIIGPALGPALRDDRIVGGIDQRAPLAARSVVVIRRDTGIGVERILLRHQPRARLEDIDPELRLAFIDP